MKKNTLARSAREAASPLATGMAPGLSRIEPLDPIIHERMRLGIVSALAVNPSLTFNELKSILKMSDGNLSVHARKLEEAGYLVSKKYFVGRVPRTEFRLTDKGRRVLERYLGHMEALIRSVRKGG